MDRFVTAGRPACPLRQEGRVFYIPNEDPAPFKLLWKWHFKHKV